MPLRNPAGFKPPVLNTRRTLSSMAVDMALEQLAAGARAERSRKAFAELKVHERHAAIDRERALLEKIAGTPSGAPA